MDENVLMVWGMSPTCQNLYIAKVFIIKHIGPNGALAKSSANGLVGTGFTSRYQCNVVF